MVSRIPYKHSYRAYLVGQEAVQFSRVVVLFLIFAVFWIYKAPMLLLIVLWYAASGPVELLLRHLRGSHRQQPATSADADTDAPEQERLAEPS